MDKNQTWASPYEAVRQAGLKSKKNRNDTKTVWLVEPDGYFLFTSGRDDSLDTHHLGRKAHVYGSSLK